jgi:hypothetical protein
MKLYEIKKEILDLMDDDDFNMDDEANLLYLQDLKLERSEKISNIARYIKTLEAEAEAIKQVAKIQTDRAKSKENKAEWLKRYLSANYIFESPFEDQYCKVSFLKSQSVDVFKGVDEIPEKFLRTKITKEPDKTAIKEAIKAGEKIDFAVIVEKKNIQIK